MCRWNLEENAISLEDHTPSSAGDLEMTLGELLAL